MSWVSEVQDFLNGAAAAAMNDAAIHQEGHGIVQVDGTIETGTERHKTLTLTGWNDTTGTITGWSQSGWDPTANPNDYDGIFTSGPEVVESDLLDDLAFARTQLNLYGDVNDTLRNFYQTEITRIQGELAKAGLFQFLAIEVTAHGLNTGDVVVYHSSSPGVAGDIGGLVDGQSYIVRKLTANKFALQNVAGGSANDIKFLPKNTSDFNQSVTRGGTTVGFNLSNLGGVAVGQYAITVTVAPIKAEAGKIDIRTDQFQGSGRFIAPGDASVTIQNHTPAFLKIMGIEIPESNGGVYLNGTPVSTNAEIFTSNKAARDDDNRNQVPGETISVALNPTFNPIPNVETAPDPAILINNDYVAGPQGNGKFYPWPNITVLGTITNLGGNVTLQTHPAGDGDVIIKATIEAKNVSVIAGGTVFITGITKYDVLGDPAAIWMDYTYGTVPGDASGTQYKGIGEASQTSIDALLASQPSSGIIGSRVIIDAEFINVNGVIQSGKEAYSVTITNAIQSEIDDITAADGTLVVLNSVSNNDIIVRYNTVTGQLEVDPLRVRGGYVDLTGHILNAGNGKIKVLGGHADFDIINNTGYALVINRIDDSQPGQGTLIMKDKAKGTPTNPYVTLYQKTGDTITRTRDDGVGGDPTQVDSVGAISTYTPESGWRYGWTVGVETKDYWYYHHDTTAWIGIDWLSADPETIEWDTHEVLDTPKLLPDSNYFYRDQGLNGVEYTYDYEKIAQSDRVVHIIDDRVESSWYGKDTYHNEVEAEQRNLHLFTHTIEADRDIKIEYIGKSAATVNIDSVGDVVLRGPILNPNGTVNIDSDGAISQTGDEAYISGKNINMTADDGIGASSAIRTDVSDLANASVKAVTDAGKVQINEIIGDLYVDQIVSKHNFLGSGAKVSVTAEGSILVATGKTGLIEGGAVTLVSGGGIGSNAHNVLLDAGTFQWDKVNIDAKGAVWVTEKAGSLNVETIKSTGDVHITVNNGGIKDANESEVRDERTYEELLGGVWHDLQLTDTTGGLDKVQEAKDTLADLKEQEYRTYWTYRASQDHAMGAELVNGGTYVVVTDFRTFDASDVEGGADTIDLGLGHGLSVGDHVQYHNGAGNSIGGLVDGQTYVVSSVVGGKITLTGVADGAATFDADLALTAAGLSLGSAHGFATGDLVRYNANGGPAINGLADGGRYYVRITATGEIKLAATKASAIAGTNLLTLSLTEGVAYAAGESLTEELDVSAGSFGGHRFDLLDSDYIKLARNAADATAATPIVLDLDGSLPTGGAHKLLKSGVVVGGTFDPATAVNSDNDTLLLGANSLVAGDVVTYKFLDYDAAFEVTLTAQEEADYRAYYATQGMTEAQNRQCHHHARKLAHGPVPRPARAIRRPWRYFQLELPVHPVGCRSRCRRGQHPRVHRGRTAVRDQHRPAEGHLRHPGHGGRPNIEAPNIFLTTSGGIGAATGQTVIDITGGPASLSPDERVALAAAERTDVSYLGADKAATVNFSSAGQTITRTGGGSWIVDGFVADMRIHVGGGGVTNATGTGEYYVIDSVTATTLTLKPGSGLVTESNKAITVTAEINNPLAPGAAAKIKKIVIDEREDVDVEISSPTGTINVTAHDSVYLGSQDNDLRLGLIQTDTTDAIRLKSSKGIVSTLAPLAVNVIGGDTILEAADGTIGTALKPITTNLGPNATLTARAQDDIHIFESSGNMNVETMFSEFGSIHLKAQGSIFDALDTDFTKMAADHIELTAVTGGIGQSGDYLELDIRGTGTIVANAATNIYLAENFGNMYVEHVESTGGNVDLRAQASILDAQNNVAPEVFGNSIKLTALAGGIGVSGNDLDIDSHGGTLTATTTVANIYITETLGDLRLNQVGTGVLQTAFINALTGSIYNGAAPGVSNVTSGNVRLYASNNIGESGNGLNTTVGNLQGKATTGSTWITNSGALKSLRSMTATTIPSNAERHRSGGLGQHHGHEPGHRLGRHYCGRQHHRDLGRQLRRECATS